LFARRHPPGRWERLRATVLPRSGFRRALQYRLHRIARMAGSPYFLAGGAALGTALALTPWFGLHFALAFVLAKLLRVSFPLALAFTLLNNPWTMPLVMAGDYELGRVILGESQLGLPPIEHITWTYLLHEGEALLLPLIVGSTPLALLGYAAVYWPLKRKVAQMQAARRIRLDARRAAMVKLEAAEMVTTV
jgi:uncharacterized protein (DUF2062 family)